MRSKDNGVARIAMWSGPRNISTALMRSFENRSDCAVIDEPFYAGYLGKTGLDHPMRAEVLASQPTDPSKVVTGLFEDMPDHVKVYYQKHMTQHMLPDIDLTWLDKVTNCFLIRSPDEIIASYLQKRDEVSEADLGLKRQYEIFNLVRERTGRVPPVLEANEVRKDPERNLRRLCECLEIPFSCEMLSWPAGKRQSDGVWARHWYGAVEKSTGFEPWSERLITLPSELSELAKECRYYYDQLVGHAI